jgi:UDP-xylose:glucoside alpha-1,3-xylosyltransferase
MRILNNPIVGPLIVIILMSINIYLCLNDNHKKSIHRKVAKFSKKVSSKVSSKVWKTPEIVIILAACGENQNSDLISVFTSALQFSSKTDRLRFEIFCDVDQRKILEIKFREFQSLRDFKVNYHNPSFPEKDKQKWENMFKRCSTQKLFVANILKDIDAAVYVDADTLFLSPPSDIFRQLEKFSEKQIMGMVYNSFKKDSFYPKSAKTPFYGEFGLNAGVVLMNLTRMRQLEVETKILDIVKQDNSTFTYADQCILNAYFKFHPSELYELPCEYNFRTDFCFELKCLLPEGIKILHGTSGIFKNQASVFGSMVNFVVNVSY